MANNSSLPKRTWILLSIFVITAIVGIILLQNANKKRDAELIHKISQESPRPTTTPQAKPAKQNIVQQAEIYTDIVKEYEGRRIQFDINCQAIPNNLTYKTGTKIMLDNRSGDARIITVDGTQHSLTGYGYKIITLTSPTLPKNILLSCGSAVNVGQILIQQ